MKASPCDLSQPGAVEKLIADVNAKLGGIDILVANTGGPPPTVFDGTSDAQWHAAFEGLFMSTVQMIRLALPGMKQRKWGRIMVVTSVAAAEPLDGLTISNAIRPGLHGLINSLSREVGKEGITVNALMPGSTATDRLKDFPYDQAEIDRTIPAGRLGKPEDFGAVATFLASEQAGLHQRPGDRRGWRHAPLDLGNAAQRSGFSLHESERPQETAYCRP